MQFIYTYVGINKAYAYVVVHTVCVMSQNINGEASALVSPSVAMPLIITVNTFNTLCVCLCMCMCMSVFACVCVLGGVAEYEVLSMNVELVSIPASLPKCQ